MTTTTTNASNTASAASGQANHPKSGSKCKAQQMSVATDGEPATKRPYLGKCQYKTGKCFNERTLKRNGNAHSLCEEHRIKQNLIQRRSDRKYQKEHAIRRRERSQRRAALKKQVSMALAQRLFIEPQNAFIIPVSQYDDLTYSTWSNVMAAEFGYLAPRIQAPQHSSAFMLDGQSSIGSPFVLSYSATGATTSWSTTGVHDGLSPSGIDDFTPYSFQNVPGVQTTTEAPQYGETKESSSGYDLPVNSRLGGKQTWSEADLEFLQKLLQV
ncbi:hypothetical protein PHYSODRAFT_490113 [Phytophthora sojae]|uniref:Uncharacterized protein n=1 Tax=Phytophthora sojae (strain P6497) TaxID=1094619 RepID=G4ZBA6_PHYSP|nr:hypothetical protein PHYSODRAFT_490113 [Phytophthora sojae]EGZ22702.1 hypothetical protein PHYSODRAFT_490113 [Phytophthora sojae]|eukprot:XP_009525419.1 hypothetical protein PHYSODRAFT_490113 [Phytophthora sojae]